jgi:hypothetical protein
MKRNVLFIPGWLLFSYLGASPALGQKSSPYTFGHGIIFNMLSTDTRFMVRQPYTFKASDTAVYQIFDHMKGQPNSIDKDISPQSPILLGIKLNPALLDFYSADVKSISKSYTSYIISDSSAAILIALGITAQNVKYYRYHVVENDSLELVPWSRIPKLEQKYGAKKAYGFLGQFKFPGRQIMVEVINTKDYNIRDGVIFDWRVNFKPVVTQIIVSTNSDQYFNLNFTKLNRNYATKFNNQTGLPLDLKIPVDSISDFRLNLQEHPTVPYVINLISNISGKVDTAQLDYYQLGDYYDFDSKYFNKPGKYELIIQRVGNLEKDQQLRLPFEVLPPPVLQKQASLKQILPYAIATLFSVALLFWAYRRNNQKRLAKSLQAKEGITMKLRSIRSQLNPHFMFNALTSIQNLMNKNDTLAANHYLAMFADLTRKVLNTSEQELSSMEDELQILEDYLQMEQLRFGFQYQIKVDKNINIANTDIPSMLLQPFIENAVKHGVATLKETGLIKVLINQQGNDLILSVTDNGKGFDKTTVRNNKTSFGLKLSEERIALLNEVYKNQPVTFTIDAPQTGTVVTIKLTNLLS